MSTTIQRRRLEIVRVEDRALAGTLIGHKPIVLEVEGVRLSGFPPYAGLKGTRLATAVSNERPCRIISDNEGARHFFWKRDDQSGAMWCFTIWGNGITRTWPSSQVELLSIDPWGCLRTEIIDHAAAFSMETGKSYCWEYPFQDASRTLNGQTVMVLACGGRQSFYLPLLRPGSRSADLSRWPDYVRTLRRYYKTDGAWTDLVEKLRGKYYHGLFVNGNPIRRAFQAVTEPAKNSGGDRRKRSGQAYCFDGLIPGLNLDAVKSVDVRSGIAWGEKGDFAWVYRVKGKTVAVIVDRPESERAAWMFADEDAAAQLLAPLLPDVEWRERYRGLKARAVYYCMHQGAWKERLILLLLLLLAEAGCKEAGEAFERIGALDADSVKAARGAFAAYQARQL